MGGVRLSKRCISMDNYSLGSLNPHPVFPQWSPLSVYPYQYCGSMQKYVAREKYYMPTLENDFLRVTVAPDIGGRIWDVYDKVGSRHLANFNNEVRTYNAGFGMNYTTGGIECNYPLAHSPTTSRQREVSTARYPDGSAAIIISELDRIWSTRWSVAFRLYPDRSFVETRVRIYNRTPHDSRYLYWNNCGLVLKERTQFIFPENAGSMHGQEHHTFSWPNWRHRDLSYWRNAPEMIGLYMLDAEEPYFGYYDHDAQFGLVHYGDVADLPGKKNWTWGSDPILVQTWRKTLHSLNEVFGEVQSGRIVIQEHLDRLPPETECDWTEIWYPVRGTGAFNGAGPGAALRAEVIQASPRLSRVKVTAMGNGFFPDARVSILSDGAAPVEQAMPLDPKAAVERMLTVKGQAGPDQRTSIVLRGKDGQILAACRLRHSNKRDSWREVIEVRNEVEPVGVEEMFRAAEEKARDWGNHELRPLYEKAIQQDAGFSPARRELGKLSTWQGLYDEAIKHLQIAQKRDPDSLELKYFLGVALMHAGRTAEARQMFELANRCDWEARSLARLAELRMREKDWCHALTHLDRLAVAHPRLTRPRGLRAICLRKLNRKAEAAAEIAEALKIDGQDPFLQIEAMFIHSGMMGRLPGRPVKTLLEQVREHEPPLLEAAFDYLSVSLDEEAEMALQIIPNAGPLALFVRASVNDRLGHRAQAMTWLRRACKLDPAGHQAWRLEMIPVLEWARSRLPKDPRPLFHLGNLYMARRRTEDGVGLWRRAEKMGERHYLLFAGLGFYESRVGREARRATKYFRKAARTEPRDLYVKHELFETLRAAGERKAALRVLEQEKSAVLGSPRLAHDLLTAYLEENDYEKFDAWCAQMDFSVNWHIPGPHLLWLKRHIQQAVQLASQGALKAALKILQELGPAPCHLGVHACWDREEDRRLYHIGCICEKLGNRDEARRSWEKALAVPHYTGWESGYWFREWSRRYFQGLSLQKLGRESEANALFDALELLAQSREIPADARRTILDLVERGRFAEDHAKDPAWVTAVQVKTKAEE